MFILYFFFSILYVLFGVLVVAFVSNELYDLDWPYSESNRNTDEENAGLVMLWAFWPVAIIYGMLYVIWIGLKYFAKAVMFYFNKLKDNLKLKLTNRKIKRSKELINDTEKINKKRNWDAAMGYVIEQNNQMASKEKDDKKKGWTD